MKRSFPQLLLLEQLNQFIKASASGRRLTPSAKRITNYLHAYRLIEKFEAKSENKLRIQLLHRASMKKIKTFFNYLQKETDLLRQLS